MDRDREIETAIREVMVYDKRLSAQPIHVSVQDGVVQLAGTVQSFRRALAAMELATSIPGVREVANRLVVTPPGDLSDSQVADHVRAALDANADVVKDAITVGVSGGIATLQGSVADTWQYAVAADVARSARGVRDVQNLLVVNLTDLVNDEEASHEIQEAIRRECGLSAASIKVAVSNRIVVLSGTVATLPQKDAAEKVAHRFGILNVRNEIHVVPQE